jgi:hypothetical protein
VVASASVLPVSTENAPPAADGKDALTEIGRAVVFSVHESGDPARADRDVDLARSVGSEVLIRVIFKWNQAPSLENLRPVVDKAHASGALFGGGITCSALYDTENNITRGQLLDMATRNPEGKLVDAWGKPGLRHGSLSSPAYLDYLFKWCREQIDAGVDYLFMDDPPVVLEKDEGYDDHSLMDFRHYLLENCPQTGDLRTDDRRWTDSWKIDLTDAGVCPDRTMASFDYRGYLSAHGWLRDPDQVNNPLRVLWQQFRFWRDDRAWKALTDRIRVYAGERGRTVVISGNGLAKYVDLQVMGVWSQWDGITGHIDLRENKIPAWHALAVRGQVEAGMRVPVVFFHDWGFSDPPFPWLAVPPSERALWMRTRGAEIYAAGAFFAFPVSGPFGCDAQADGTLPVMQQQSAFYRMHRDLYLKADYLGFETPRSDTPNLSFALWIREGRTILLHVINRNVTDGTLYPQKNVIVQIPLDRVPKECTLISPDFAGERPLACRKSGDNLEIALGDIDAYAVAVLSYDGMVDTGRVIKEAPRTIPTGSWARPDRSEFHVRPDGLVEEADALIGFLQGQLHPELRNPPSFLVNALSPGKLTVHIRSVAAAGARVEYRVDDRPVQYVDLPDLDGMNDAVGNEYDKTLSFPIPAGTHRLTLDNVGKDWAYIAWVAFEGSFKEYRWDE